MSQKKVKFNIVDIIVILILIAGVAFVGTKMFGGQEPAAADPASGAPYLVTFHADCVPEEVAATLSVGSKSENASRNMDLGTLVDFTPPNPSPTAMTARAIAWPPRSPAM